MAGRVDEVQQIGLAISCVEKRSGLSLDSDSTFLFNLYEMLLGKIIYFAKHLLPAGCQALETFQSSS